MRVVGGSVPGRSAALVVTGAVLTTVVLAGCSGLAQEKMAFDRREPLASCGTVEIGQGATVHSAYWACLDKALTTGAELVVTRLTTEGDPVIWYYRVSPKIEGVEVFVDSTADRNGSGWSRMVCATNGSVAELSECVETVLPATA